MRRPLLVLVSALLSCSAAAQYPTKPIRFIVPSAPGGAPDVLMRLLGQKLAEKWGQGVVIENRAGGNTLIGTVAASTTWVIRMV